MAAVHLYRAWLLWTVLCVQAALVLACLPAFSLIADYPQYHHFLWQLTLGGLGVAALCKLALGCWLTRRVAQCNLLEPGHLPLLAGSWLVSVILLFAIVRWLVPTEVAASWLLALPALLVIPYNRLVGTPLAVPWNRHR